MRKALVFGAILAFARLAAALNFVDGEITASAAQTFTGVPNAGYAPVWVELQNKGSRPAEVEVRFKAYSSDGRVSRATRLDPGEKRVVSLPVPASLPVGELEVFRSGDKLAGSLSVNVRGVAGLPVLAIGSEAAWKDAFGAIDEQGRNAPLFVESRHAPDLVAGYVGWSRVVLLEDASHLPAPARAALESWVKSGGYVIFAGPAATQPALDRWRASDALAEPEALGFGRVEACAGPCQLFPQLMNTRTFRAEGEDDGQGGSYSQGYRGSLLPEVGQTPVGAFLVIILLFAIAIGPVNFAIASRRGRHLMLITIPALAATTCAGIATYGIAADGLFSKHFAGLSLTWLDADAHDATTLAVTGSYASLAPGRLRFPAGTALLPPTERTGGLSLDWSNGLAVGGDFLPSRTYRERAFLVTGPSRARVTVHQGRVENALGATVTRILLKSQGKVLVAGPVADGAAGDLAPLAEGDGLLTRSEYESRYTQPLLDAAFALPAEGEFVAEVENAAFAPEGDLKPTRHRVLGVVRGKVAR